MSNGSRMDVLCITERNGKSFFSRIGAAFPTNDGMGWSVTLDALPVSGKLLIKPPLEKKNQDDRRPGHDDFPG